MIQKGRIRYIITCDCDNGTWIQTKNTIENVLTHSFATASPALMELVSKSQVSVQFTQATRGFDKVSMNVFVWRYKGELPEGPAELGVPIPNTGWTL
ncbi:MAG: hypothetical protein AAF458_09445 [Pseudomonadota bacterium]